MVIAFEDVQGGWRRFSKAKNVQYTNREERERERKRENVKFKEELDAFFVGLANLFSRINKMVIESSFESDERMV